MVDQRFGGVQAFLCLILRQDRNATTKASAKADTPSTLAVRLSRSNPVTRDSIVMLEMAARVLSKFMAEDYIGRNTSGKIWFARLGNIRYNLTLYEIQLCSR